MAVLLIVVGLGWALLGAGNFIGTLGMQIDKPVPSELMVTASLLFNVLLFIFPGLGLAGIGAAIRSRTPGSRADSTRRSWIWSGAWPC